MVDDIKPAPKSNSDNKPVSSTNASDTPTDDLTQAITPDTPSLADEPAEMPAEEPVQQEEEETSEPTDDESAQQINVSVNRPAVSMFGSEKSDDKPEPTATKADSLRRAENTDETPAANSEPPMDKSDNDAPVVASAPAASTGSGKPHRKSKWPLLVVLLIVVAAAAGAYWWYTQRPTAKPTPVASTVVKKDIPNIRYVTTNKGWDTFYPATDDSSNYAESNAMLFEGLVRYENKTQIVPSLATGWTNPDPSTWVFNLRQGVKFHTGREMTADDVKASFEAAKDTDNGDIYFTTVKSVEVTGKYQVTLKTDGPDPTLLDKLTNYFVFDTKSGKPNDPVNGTGPFVVKPGTTPKDDSLELVAFDQYHGGRVHVRSFSFVGLDQDDQGKAYADGKANLMSFESKPTALGSRPYQSAALEPVSVFMMPLNTLKAGSPLQKLQVRQAIQLSLDPLAVAKAQGIDAAEPATQIVPSSIPGYDPTVAKPTRDVAKAKQLLASAGYPNGISYTLTYFAREQATAEEISKELAESGIKLKLDPQTEVKTLAAKAQGGGTDSYFTTYSSDILDASDALSNYADSPNYKNQAVLDLLEKAKDTLNSSQRLTYLKQASHKMASDLGIIPIFVPNGDEIIYDPSFVIQRDVANTNLGIYFQKVYAK